VKRRALEILVAFAGALALALGPAGAGQIDLTWDPVAGASGYYVYYGLSSGNYGQPISTTTNSISISGLQDCTNYYVALKAYNTAGVSPQFSNGISGWARPNVTSVTPTTALQGDQVVVDITGANFQGGAAVDLGNPNVVPSSVAVLTCNHIQLLATVEPTAKSIRPAQVGSFDLTIANPDSVFGTKTQAFQVLINPARFDINQSDPSTTNRIDGKDTVYLSRLFAISESDPNYDPDDDFNGDGWIDGDDLAYIASNLGRCWASATKSWTLAACPASLQ
jgi:hypothetical protein